MSGIRHIEGKLIVIHVVEDAENHQEEINEVKIEADSAHDVLIGTKSLGDEVGVEYNISTEQQASEEAIDQVHCSAKWNEDSNETGHEEGDQTTEQIGAQAWEIVLGLEREQGESQEDTKRNQQGLEHNDLIVEGDNDAQRHALHNREGRQKDEVDRIAVSFPE